MNYVYVLLSKSDKKFWPATNLAYSGSAFFATAWASNKTFLGDLVVLLILECIEQSKAVRRSNR